MGLDDQISVRPCSKSSQFSLLNGVGVIISSSCRLQLNVRGRAGRKIMKIRFCVAFYELRSEKNEVVGLVFEDCCILRPTTVKTI